MASLDLAIGKMDRRVAIMTRTQGAANAYSEKTFTYSTLATVWGQKIELSLSEQLQSNQITSETIVRFRIYYRNDVTATSRIVVDGVTYQVVGTQEIGRRDFTLILCKAILP